MFMGARLTDRFGTVNLLLVGIFGLAASYAFAGLAPTPNMILVAMAMVGFFSGAFWMNLVIFANQSAPPQLRATGQSLVGAAQAAVKPLELFTAPVFAVRRLMERTGTTLDSYDLFEINEAFAAQVVANGRELGIDWDRLNVHGGAIALGHPLGGSGARILTTLLYHMRDNNIRYGLQTMCEGGGQANATILELL